MAFATATYLLFHFIVLRTLRPLRKFLLGRRRGGDTDPQGASKSELASEFGEFSSEISHLFDGEPGVVTELQLSEQRAIKQARLYEALSKTNQVISIRLAPEEMFTAICRICVATKVATFAWIGVVEEGLLNPVASAGSSMQNVIELLAELGTCEPTGMALREGMSSIVEQCASPLWLFSGANESWASPFAAAGAFPILQRGQVVAVLTLYGHNVEAFDGTFVRLIEEMTHDVSFGLDNHKRELELRERELQLDAVVESATEAIVTADTSLKIVVFNSAAGMMFGLNKEQAIGSDIGRLLSPGTRTKRLAHLRSFVDSKPGSATSSLTRQVTGVRGNGEPFPLKAIISCAGVSGKLLLTVVVKDMSGVRAAASARSRP